MESAETAESIVAADPIVAEPVGLVAAAAAAAAAPSLVPGAGGTAALVAHYSYCQQERQRFALGTAADCP